MKVESKKPELRDISTLVPYELNAKKHDKEQIERLKNSIERFGWRGNPIIVDKEGVIIAGHGRRLAALALGLTKVPVIVEEDMTADQARAFRLADNRAAISDIDTNLFRQDLELIDLEDLRGIFDEKELTFSSADIGEMNMDVFVDDLADVVSQQAEEVGKQVEEAKDKRFPLAKTFGFKDVSCENARVIANTLAQLKAEHDLEGEDALTYVFSRFND